MNFNTREQIQGGKDKMKDLKYEHKNLKKAIKEKKEEIKKVDEGRNNQINLIVKELKEIKQQIKEKLK